MKTAAAKLYAVSQADTRAAFRCYRKDGRGRTSSLPTGRTVFTSPSLDEALFVARYLNSFYPTQVRRSSRPDQILAFVSEAVRFAAAEYRGGDR